MSDEAERTRLQHELDDVTAQIADLRRSSAGVTAELGGTDVEDSEDIAAELTNVQENEAVLALLEQRRESLADKLAAAQG